MFSTTTRILVVGVVSNGTSDTLRRFASRGWGTRSVPTVQEAKKLLATAKFDIVLASESLRDGRGYDLAESVAAHSRTLLVGVSLYDSCLWLPVVHCGENVLGKRGLNSQALETEMEALLKATESGAIREIVPVAPAKTTLALLRAVPDPQRAPIFRRKYRDRLNVPM